MLKLTSCTAQRWASSGHTRKQKPNPYLNSIRLLNPTEPKFKLKRASSCVTGCVLRWLTMSFRAWVISSLVLPPFIIMVFLTSSTSLGALLSKKRLARFVLGFLQTHAKTWRLTLSGADHYHSKWSINTCQKISGCHHQIHEGFGMWTFIYSFP